MKHEQNKTSHEAIANLKRLCVWLEELRKRYNDKYVVVKGDVSTTLDMTNGGKALGMTERGTLGMTGEVLGRDDKFNPK